MEDCKPSGTTTLVFTTTLQFIVTLIGSCEVIIINPSNSIGLTTYTLTRTDRHIVSIFGVVDVIEIYFASREIGDDITTGIKNNHMIILLQSNNNFTFVIDINKLRFRIARSNASKSTNICIIYISIKSYNCDITCRILRNQSVVEVFVPFIFNSNSSKLAIGTNRHSIWLTSKSNLLYYFIVPHINHYHLT